MDKQSKNKLPEQCLFMNANGEIMRIEYGKSGFSRSELNTENRKANQVIVNSYNERHGITAEQIDTMHIPPSDLCATAQREIASERICKKSEIVERRRKNDTGFIIKPSAAGSAASPCLLSYS